MDSPMASIANFLLFLLIPMPHSRTRAIAILTRQCRNKSAQLGIVLSHEAQLKDLEDLIEDCRHRRTTADDDIAARLATVEVTAHKAIALMREMELKRKPKDDALPELTDGELEQRRLHLVKELSK